MNAGLQYRVEQFLYRHAELCDAQDWDGYLAQFDEQCEFHLPQWESEQRYTRDPKRETSPIYYSQPCRPGRPGVPYPHRQGRVHRADAAHPAPDRQRAHRRGRRDGLRVWSTGRPPVPAPDQTGSFFGHATYRLKPHGEAWLIARKHIVLLNDRIDSVLDFYHL